jgi:hypothetical protein
MEAAALTPLEGACRLFGWQATTQALSNKQFSAAYALRHPNAVAQAARQLEAMLSISEATAIAYCQLLTPELRDCLICCIARDVAFEAIEQLGITQKGRIV